MTEWPVAVNGGSRGTTRRVSKRRPVSRRLPPVACPSVRDATIILLMKQFPAILLFGLVVFLVAVGYFVGTSRPHDDSLVEKPPASEREVPLAQAAPLQPTTADPPAVQRKQVSAPPPSESAEPAHEWNDRSDDEVDIDPALIEARNADEANIRKLRDSARTAFQKQDR